MTEAIASPVCPPAALTILMFTFYCVSLSLGTGHIHLASQYPYLLEDDSLCSLSHEGSFCSVFTPFSSPSFHPPIKRGMCRVNAITVAFRNNQFSHLRILSTLFINCWIGSIQRTNIVLAEDESRLLLSLACVKKTHFSSSPVCASSGDQ